MKLKMQKCRSCDDDVLGCDICVECANFEMIKNLKAQLESEREFRVKIVNEIKIALSNIMKNDKTKYDYGDARGNGELPAKGGRWIEPRDIALLAFNALGQLEALKELDKQATEGDD